MFPASALVEWTTDAGGRAGGLDFEVWPTRGLLPRIRRLAPDATVYHAAYLALAEHAMSPLLTIDAKLAAVPGITCRVIVA